MRAMVIRIPMQSGYGGVRHVPVSLPRIDCLIEDEPGKYSTPEARPVEPLSRADTQPIGVQRWYRHGRRRQAEV